MFDYNKILSKNVVSIKPSGIRRFFDLAEEMEGVVSLGLGEPGFVTPKRICDAAIASINEGKTSYSANTGIAPLKHEISRYLSEKYNIHYKNEEMIVTIGASEAIDIAFRAILEPGDEVLVVEPCFVSYAPTIQLCGAVPVSLVTKAEDKFRLTAKSLKEKITDKTKALIMSFPSNPTGAIMKREHLEEIAAVLRDTNIIVITDEIYAELTYGYKHVSFAEIEGMRERTIFVSGFSKAFAMTGWRIGYSCAPVPITKEMMKIHQYAVMCPPTAAQYGALVALRDCDNDSQAMIAEYNKRRQYIVGELNRMGLRCFDPEGAFYVFPDIRFTGLSSEEFCERLLTSKKVSVVPGNAFGDCGEGFVRMSYSNKMENIVEAMKRIEEFLHELKA